MPTWGWIAIATLTLIAGLGIGMSLGSFGGGADRPGSGGSASYWNPTPTPTATTPAVLPTPDEFRIDVIILDEKCFGSAGCSVKYQLKPTYIGTESLSGTKFTVVYQVDGGNQPQIGNFAVINGDANVNRQTSIDTDSESSTLTAKATQILPE
jgi:hypothetical protein